MMAFGFGMMSVAKHRWRRPLGALVAAVALLAAAACYYPARFDAEIEISRIGYYKITYDGYVADVPLVDGLRKREISAADEARKSQSIVTDLKRDRNTKEASYVRQGLFKINWVDEGDLTVAKLVTFIRRNENILSIKYIQTTG